MPLATASWFLFPTSVCFRGVGGWDTDWNLESCAKSPLRWHVNCPRARWRKILLTKESRYLSKILMDVLRLQTSSWKLRKDCVEQVDRFEGGWVGVWTRRKGIHHGYLTPPVWAVGALTAERYRDETLLRPFLPFMNINVGLCQHGNTRPHVAQVCIDLLAHYYIPTLPRLAHS